MTPHDRFNPMGGPNHGQNGEGQGPGYYPTNAPMYNTPPNQEYDQFRSTNPEQAAASATDIPAPTEEMVANCFHHTQGRTFSF